MPTLSQWFLSAARAGQRGWLRSGIRQRVLDMRPVDTLNGFLRSQGFLLLDKKLQARREAGGEYR